MGQAVCLGVGLLPVGPRLQGPSRCHWGSPVCHPGQCRLWSHQPTRRCLLPRSVLPEVSRPGALPGPLLLQLPVSLPELPVSLPGVIASAAAALRLLAVLLLCASLRCHLGWSC